MNMLLINEIKLKIMHEKKIKKNFITKKNFKNNFEKKLNTIQNNDLKNSLDRLIQAYNSKR